MCFAIALYVFLASYCLNVFLYPVFSGGGSSSKCRCCTFHVTKGGRKNQKVLHDKTAVIPAILLYSTRQKNCAERKKNADIKMIVAQLFIIVDSSFFRHILLNPLC